MISFAVISVYGMMMASNISQYKYRELRNDKAIIESTSLYTNNELFSSIEATNAKIADMLNLFNSIDEPFKVRQYLAENRDTLDLLYEAIIHFKEAFTQDTLYSISLIDNSEEDEAPQIYVRAESTKDLDIMFTQLDDFYKNWWIEQVCKSNGKLVFGIS